MGVLIIGAIAWATIAVIEARIGHPRYAGSRRDVTMRVLLNQLATLPFIVAGVGLLGWGERAAHWIVPGVLLSFVYVFIQVWVLLVEINR